MRFTLLLLVAIALVAAVVFTDAAPRPNLNKVAKMNNFRANLFKPLQL